MFVATVFAADVPQSPIDMKSKAVAEATIVQSSTRSIS
jgi:hypothetical protein